MKSPINPKSTEYKQESSFFGLKNLLNMIQKIFNKTLNQAKIPEASINLYQESLRQIRNIAAIAKQIDDVKFSGKEFKTFVGMNMEVTKNEGHFEGLKDSIDLLRVALETKECFLKIESTESRYQAFAQKDFYDYIFELLETHTSKDQFKILAEKKLAETIPKMKTDEGKAALEAYMIQLDILAKDELGLKLLFLFKQSDLSNFALLKTVADIADTFYDRNLMELKEFTIIVQVQPEIFLKLGEIIQVPKAKNIPDTYAMILQYIALRNRHNNSFSQFQQLIRLLKDWASFYQPVLAIRTEYPPEEYKQPPIFKEEIPGLTLYNKYQNYIDIV